NKSPGMALLVTLASHLAVITCAGIAIATLGDLTIHAQTAMLFAMLAAAAFHAGIGALYAIYGLLRQWSGKLSPVRTLDLRIGKLWHEFSAVAVLACVVMAFVLQTNLIAGTPS